MRPAPWVSTGEFWFPCQTLNPFRSLPLVHHYKETAAPHSSFSQVTIVMRPRKARAVGLDLNSVAVETRQGQTGAGSIVRGVGFHCQRFEKLQVGEKHLV